MSIPMFLHPADIEPGCAKTLSAETFFTRSANIITSIVDAEPSKQLPQTSETYPFDDSLSMKFAEMAA
jgi:hypothetical protein